MSRVKEIDLQQMTHLRNITQKVSQFLQTNLEAYVYPLIPLLAPDKTLGEYMEGPARTTRTGYAEKAEKALNLLTERYAAICRDTFSYPTKIPTPVPAIKTKLRIYPWEYLYALGDDPAQTISVFCPTQWVLAYDLPYTLSDLHKSSLAQEKPSAAEAKQLIINSLTLWISLERLPGVKKILEDLRFPVAVKTSTVTGELPFLVISSAVESFRPKDELIQMVTQLSGKRVFEELVDQEEIDRVQDSFVAKLKELATG